MKIGFSIADITPEIGIYLTGYGNPERLATSVHSPLEAIVMAMQDEEKTAVIIGLDWCFVGADVAEDICKGICEKTGVPEKHILLSCTHTHSAPHTTRRKTKGRTAVDPENKGLQYAYDCIPVIADAVQQALNNLRECKAAFAHTHTKTGVSRRGTDENGAITWQFRQDPDLIYDSNMTAVHFRDVETNEDLGIFVHASCHNTAMGPYDRSISSDWCGVMKRRIRKAYNNIPVIFINGAIGDVGPRTNFAILDRTAFAAGGGDGPESAEEVGYRAATDALRALEDLRDFRTDLPLKIHLGELRLPQEYSMPLDQVKEVLEQFADKEDRESDKNVSYQVAKYVHEASLKPFEPEIVTPQTIIAFGPVAVVPFPYEVFSIFSLRLRKFGPFEYTLLASNTNGTYAYMPDRGSFAMGGYETTCSALIRPYKIKPEAGDVAVTQCLASLREM